MSKPMIRRLLPAFAALLLSACALSPFGRPQAPPADQAQGPVQMVAAANPLAARAGMAVLERGGTAVQAAVAKQPMLGIVEPQR